MKRLFFFFLVMVIVRLQKIEKIKKALNFDGIRHKWCKIKKLTFMCKVHILLRGYFLLPRKASLLIFHLK